MYILVDTSERLHVSLIQTFQCTLGKLSIIVYLFRLNVIKKKVKHVNEYVFLTLLSFKKPMKCRLN